MYGHHGSKAAGNMIGKLLGFDLKEKGIPVAMIHVSQRQCTPYIWTMLTASHGSLVSSRPVRQLYNTLTTW